MIDPLPFQSASSTDPEPFIPPNAPDIRTFALAQMGVALMMERTLPGRPFRELRVAVGTSADGDFQPTLTLASDMPGEAEAVVRGDVDLGVFNPSGYLTMAYRGVGPYPQPLPLRAIGVMPSLDWQVFAVSKRFNLPSVAAIAEQKLPLRISVRADPKNSTRFVVDQVLGAYGFSLADIESWGGSIQLIERPREQARVQGLRDGTLDAVFDEGISGWGHLALECGLRFVPLDDAGTARMKELGWRIIPVSREEFPELTEDHDAVSFSGWPLFTRADLPDEMAYQMAKALDRVRPMVQWDAVAPVELRDLCVSSDECPLDVPLHPGAVRYYQERGAL
jgi:TRAP-type uncharacterized transport system substrate-binding protein